MQLPDVITVLPFLLGIENGSFSCPDATHHYQKNTIRISLIAILIKKATGTKLLLVVCLAICTQKVHFPYFFLRYT